MAYCTVDDVRRLLADMDFTLPPADAEPQHAIEMAQAWLDAYLESAGLAVPLTTVPSYVSLCCANYACYLLVRRKNTVGEFSEIMNEFKTEAYRLKDDFVKGLADIPGENAIREDIGLPTVVNLE